MLYLLHHWCRLLYHNTFRGWFYRGGIRGIIFRSFFMLFFSLCFRRFLRVKTLLSKGATLEVPSVWDIYKSADWLERECYDMFGIRFAGHPDLRRLLMWEQYKEGYPLRKDFPLRGRFSRSEQLRQALSANPEARYSKEELSIADAFEDLPADMRQRLGGGERTGE